MASELRMNMNAMMVILMMGMDVAVNAKLKKYFGNLIYLNHSLEIFLILLCIDKICIFIIIYLENTDID